jgi:hypothetical protein
MYQAMFHEQHCRSFYLHTLLHHAGDFMRELEKDGMCLGMMSNSGAERRHEYGRRAAKKALAGGCWRAKVPELASRQNWMAYLTLKEIMIWQHGTDLVSHELAVRAAAPAADRSGAVLSRRRAASAAAASDGCADSSAADDLDPTVELPTVEETRQAMDEVAEIANEHHSTPALVIVDFEGEDGVEGQDGLKKGRDGKLMYVVDEDRELFRGRDELCGVLEQESVAGSDDFEDEDAEVMARRLKDLDELRGDWLPDEDEGEDEDFRSAAGDDSDTGDEVAWVAERPIAQARGKRANEEAAPVASRPPWQAPPTPAPASAAVLGRSARPVASAPTPLPGPPASSLSAGLTAPPK